MSVWFVKPEEVKIDLVYTAPDGAQHPLWIKVKKSLTVGEQRRVMTAGWRGIGTGGADDEGRVRQEISIDWKSQTFARAEAYLVAWSIGEGVHGPTREVIETLDGPVYAVIENAIAQHVASVAEEKKQPSGSESPSVTSA